jgi:hypothetical protein
VRTEPTTKRGMTSRWGAVVLALLAFVLFIPALALSVYSIDKFRMPYNEEGRYFDGLVVHHAGSEYVLGLLALALWALAVLALAGAHRIHRRAPPN